MIISNENSVSSTPTNTAKLLDTEIARLAHLLYSHTLHDGVTSLPIPGLYATRYSDINLDFIKTFYLPSLAIVAQGSKSVTVGRETYQFGRCQMMMLPVALPVALKAVNASKSEPLLTVKLDLDPQRIAELVLKVYPSGLPPVRQWSSGYVVDADVSIVNAVTRLVECLQNPGDAELLGPLIMEEILIRLLRSPIGVYTAQMGLKDSGVHHIAEAVDWLCKNFSRQIKVADLAALTHMSVSSFYEHFKAVTSMTPLQYQKALRLQEARNLMLSRQMDATTACRMVGYVSDSHFSRDYRSFFKDSPRRDIINISGKTIGKLKDR